MKEYFKENWPFVIGLPLSFSLIALGAVLENWPQRGVIILHTPTQDLRFESKKIHDHSARGYVIFTLEDGKEITFYGPHTVVAP